MRLPRSISSIRVALKLQGMAFFRVRNTSQISEEVHNLHNNVQIVLQMQQPYLTCTNTVKLLSVSTI
jgi:hypothetical protein